MNFPSNLVNLLIGKDGFMSKAIKIIFSVAALAGLAAAIIAIMGKKRQPKKDVVCEEFRILARAYNEDDELVGVGVLTGDSCGN